MERDDDKTQTHAVLTDGTMVGHYRIIEKIGAGGMGEVYLAQDTELDRKVALKFLPHHLCSDVNCRKRFTREAQAAAKLDHPNIVPIHEVDEFQGRPYFVMAVIEGPSLRDYVASLELIIGRIFEISLQICEGLQAAHDQGIIHRDIKPSNILIDSNGRARIVDFGLATIRGSEQLTKTGSTLGTVGYMSPEQIQVKEVDRRSDLFSFGVVLYEMITGRLPFKGDTEAAVMNSVLNDKPEPLSRFKSGVSGELEHIVAKLLEKDPQLRYQSAAGVISDLKRLSAPEPATAKSRVDWWNRYVVPSAVVVLLATVVFWYQAFDGNKQTDTSPADKIMLAVLPFENLGEPDDEYFADGMTEEIMVRLAVVHDLGVIARTSVMPYKRSDKSVTQIAKELGVDYILEGTVRWQKSDNTTGRIRVTPQLIKADDAIHVWAEIYDEVITQVFDMQTDIAQQVVEELNIVLAGSEQEAINTKPTENLRAYDLYVRAWEYRDQFMGEEDLVRAQRLFEQAIALDSGFLAAIGSLSMIHSTMYWFGYDLTSERVAKAKETADLVIAKDPDGPWGHFALGYYFYYGIRDYDQALIHLEKVLEKVPNQPEALSAVAYVNRRKGAFDRALELQRQALELDPLSLSIRLNLAGTCFRMRRADDEIELLKETVELYPDNMLAAANLTYSYISSKGDLESARAVIRDASAYFDTTAFHGMYWLIAVIEGDFDLAISIDPVGFDTAKTAIDSADYYMSKAQALHWGGYEGQSRVYYDSARVVLEQLDYINLFSNPFSWPSLGLAYAGLGRKEDAIRAGQELVDYSPLSEDAMVGATPLVDMARIYARVDEPDRACDLIDQLMSFPSGLTVHDLRLDPNWIPLRDHPRFQALLEKYERRHGI